MDAPPFQFTGISLIILAAVFINAGVSYAAWARKRNKAGKFFSWGMIATTLWTITAALDYAATTISLKVFFAKLEVICYSSALFLLMLFMLVFAGYEGLTSNRWFYRAALSLPVSNILLVLTEPLHGLIWSGFSWNDRATNILIFHHGPAFSWLTATGYFMILVVIGAAWLASRRGSEISRRQGMLMFLAALLPVFANLIYRFGIGGIEGVDWTSVTFSISGVLLLLALYGARFLDLVPIARHMIIEKMQDAVLVLDAENRLIDFNPQAENLFDLNKNLLGTSVQDILKDMPEHFSTSGETFTYQHKTRVFDVQNTRLFDSNGFTLGALVVLVDVTKRYQTEQALATHIAEIEDLNNELKQAQARLLEQERAFAILGERRRLGRDMHDSVNQTIHSLMLLSDTLGDMLDKRHFAGETQEILKRIQNNGRQAMKEIRMLVFETQNLFTGGNTSLIDAVNQRLNMVERRAGMQVDVVCGEVDIENFPAVFKENLYWMIMEALNNSLKYSNAREITIQFQPRGDGFLLEVADDGSGFDTARMGSGGFGLRTMRERAQILGGHLEIVSSPGDGTRVNFLYGGDVNDE